LFNPAGGSAPHRHSFTILLPRGVERRFGGKKNNSLVEIKLFIKVEKRKRIIIMTVFLCVCIHTQTCIRSDLQAVAHHPLCPASPHSGWKSCKLILLPSDLYFLMSYNMEYPSGQLKSAL